MTDAIVEARELIKIYRSRGVRFAALRGVSLDVRAGEFLALTGPSGSGKSTILNLLAGLDLPTSGTVRLLGEFISDMSETGRARFRRKNVGFIFQDFSLLPMNALDNVAFPLLLRGVPERIRREGAMRLLEQVGLGEHAAHFPDQLSGGQQQRVSIARALITRPEILFADEPTGNLDRASSVQVMDLLSEAVKERGTTLVLVTHDEHIARSADRAVRIEDGAVSENGGNEG